VPGEGRRRLSARNGETRRELESELRLGECGEAFGKGSLALLVLRRPLYDIDDDACRVGGVGAHVRYTVLNVC
jgi:hypothetical protein